MMGPLCEWTNILKGRLKNLLHQSEFFMLLEQAPGRGNPGLIIITPTNSGSQGTLLSFLFPQGSGDRESIQQVEGKGCHW